LKLSISKPLIEDQFPILWSNDFFKKITSA
jgi:hypothetical protein